MNRSYASRDIAFGWCTWQRAQRHSRINVTVERINVTRGIRTVECINVMRGTRTHQCHQRYKNGSTVQYHERHKNGSTVSAPYAFVTVKSQFQGVTRGRESGGVRSGPGAARTILLFHIISARPSKQPRMVRTFLKVHTRPKRMQETVRHLKKGIVTVSAGGPLFCIRRRPDFSMTVSAGGPIFCFVVFIESL